MTAQLRSRTRRGQILILAPFCLGCLCAIAALCVDVGSFCSTDAKLQAAADAGALAGVLELWEQRAQGDSADETAHRNSADAEGRAVSNLNELLSRSEVEFGVWENGAFVPVSHTVAANAVKVRAIRDDDAPGGPVAAVFARILGLCELDEKRSAVARFQHPRLVPVGVDEDALVPPGQLLVMYDDTETAPGNCGLLDFDGGENSANDTKDWISNGYPGPFRIDPAIGHKMVEGNTGLQTSITVSLDYHIAEGDVIVGCIYSAVSGVGAGVEYTIVGYVAMVVTGYTTEGKNPNVVELVSVEATVIGIYFVATGETEGELTGFMMLQLVE